MNLRQKAKKYKKEYKRLMEYQSAKFEFPRLNTENYKVKTLKSTRFIEQYELYYEGQIKRLMIDEISKLLFDDVLFMKQADVDTGRIKLIAKLNILEKNEDEL